IGEVDLHAYNIVWRHPPCLEDSADVVQSLFRFSLEVAGDLTVSVLSHAGYIKCVAHEDSVAPGGTRLGSRRSETLFSAATVKAEHSKTNTTTVASFISKLFLHGFALEAAKRIFSR